MIPLGGLFMFGSKAMQGFSDKHSSMIENRTFWHDQEEFCCYEPLGIVHPLFWESLLPNPKHFACRR